MKKRALLAALVCLSLGGVARAEGVAELVAEVTPIHGANAPFVSGWNELLVRISNAGSHAVKGEIEATSRLGYTANRTFLVAVPFAAGAGASVNVRVPIAAPQYADVVARVLGEHGEEITTRHFSTTVPNENAFLLDVNDPSLVRAELNEVPIAPGFAPSGARSHGSVAELLVGSPRMDPATGDPLLPDRPALYGGTNAMLIRSDVLSRVSGAELESLSDYVLSGGTIAIAVTRPEDLLNPTLVAFAGGPVTRGSVSPATMRDLVLPPPPPGAGPTKRVPDAIHPNDELSPLLTGFSGGNLRASVFGSTAAYGLGEVHLLAFDPTRKPASDDAWAQARVIEIARRAFDRRSSIIFPPGADDADPNLTRVRQQLDPNENSRWGIAASAVLLCLYALLAGPLNFLLASNKGRPLRALRRLPIFATAAFVGIVGIGTVAKGIRGRARHLTLIEAAAGMTKGTARRYRGFFASQAKDITVRSTDWSGVLRSVVVHGDDTDGVDRLVVNRDGTRLADISALPWQTVVIREDATAHLGGGIALAEKGGATFITNRSGWDLRAAVLRLPGAADPIFFARIKDGDSVASSAGRALSRTSDERAWSSGIQAGSTHGGWIPLHGIVAHAMPSCFEQAAPGIREALGALAMAAGEMVDWFPEDVPVLIAQLDGGEGGTRDAGLRLESDRALVRVVGWGGNP